MYSQIIGRGTRIHPQKQNLLVLDFLWHTERHALVRPAHLVASSPAEADTITSILEAAAKEFGTGGAANTDGRDLLALVADAKAERENELVKQLDQNARRSSQLLDPVEFALSLHEVDLADWEPTMPWHNQAASAKQLSVLQNLGFDPNAVRSRGHASVLLDRVFMRRNLKLATPKQVAWLRRKKHPHPETASFTEAKAFLSQKFTR
jgi:type I site-specific restriction endonuclease